MDQEKKKLVENYVAMCVARGIDATRARKYAEEYYGVNSITSVESESEDSEISENSKEISTSFFHRIHAKFGKDFWRPIYGTVVLQPVAVGWALATETASNTFTDIYWSNLGPFTIVATIFLIPAYALYERIYPRS